MTIRKKLLAVAATCVLIAGCSATGTGENPSDNASDQGSTTEAVPAAPSDEGGGDSSEDDGSAASSSDGGGEDVPDPGVGVPPATAEESPTEVPGVIDEPGDYNLTLSRAEPNNSWEEASFNVPGTTGSVTAIGTELQCWDEEELEFRFSLESGEIEFVVAQDLESESSYETMSFALIVDGATEDTAEIDFDESATLTADLTGASAVVLRVENTSCERGRATVLVTSVKVSS